jgi:hypothetical protein
MIGEFERSHEDTFCSIVSEGELRSIERSLSKSLFPNHNRYSNEL